jgi:hypothetical protein
VTTLSAWRTRASCTIEAPCWQSFASRRARDVHGQATVLDAQVAHVDRAQPVRSPGACGAMSLHYGPVVVVPGAAVT